MQAHIFIGVLAYALWKTLDHRAKQAGRPTEIRKPDPKRSQATPQDRPLTPEVILRELANVRIGDILRETTEGQQLALRRVARPNAEPKRILAAWPLHLPARWSPDQLLEWKVGIRNQGIPRLAATSLCPTAQVRLRTYAVGILGNF